MNFLVVPQISQFFESVDPDVRDARIKKLRDFARRVKDAGKAEKARKIAGRKRIPGGAKTNNDGKVTFSREGYKSSPRRATKHGKLANLRGYMHNPGASLHTSRTKKDGSKRWYKV